MDNDPRIVELLTDMAKGIDQLVAAQATTNERLDHLEQSINTRLERLERQQAKTNMILQDHTLAIVKLADKIEQIPEVLNRVAKLEAAVFH